MRPQRRREGRHRLIGRRSIRAFATPPLPLRSVSPCDVAASRKVLVSARPMRLPTLPPCNTCGDAASRGVDRAAAHMCCSNTQILSLYRHIVPVARVGRRIGRALTSILRDAATSHGESEPSDNGGVEKARIDLLPMRRCRPSLRSHPPPSCRHLAPMAALNAP